MHVYLETERLILRRFTADDVDNPAGEGAAGRGCDEVDLAAVALIEQLAGAGFDLGAAGGRIRVRDEDLGLCQVSAARAELNPEG